MSTAPSPGTRLLSARGLQIALGDWWGLFLLVVGCNVIALLAIAAATVAGAWAVGSAALGAAPDELWTPTVIVAVAVVVRGLGSWLESWLGHDLSFRMMSRVRSWVFAAMARVAPNGLARRRTGDLATTTMSDSETLEIFYAHSSIYIASALITTPLLLGAVAVFSPLTTLAVLPVLAIAVLVPLAMRRAARRQGAAVRSLIAELGAEVSENVGATREIVGFGMTEARIARLEALNTRLGAAQRANARRAGLESAIGGAASIAATLVAAAVGAVELASGELAPLALTPLVALTGSTPSAILQWIGVTKHYGTTREAAGRIETILDAPDPVDRSGQAALETSGPLGIETRGLTYSWPGTSRPALRDVSLSVQPGETLALAGRSGAGKSTLAGVLARFMDPDEGTVLIDGRPLRTLSRDATTEAVSLIPQEAYMFRISVRENLLLAAGPGEQPGEPELWAALEAAGAADIVRRLPDGLDTILGERGSSLSGGERQRLALARAVLHRSRILILDESVSQLDVMSEQTIRNSLAAAQESRTSLVIAHRLSTLLGADRIVVLDDGRLVGDGTHAQLLTECPAYAELVGPQLEALEARLA